MVSPQFRPIVGGYERAAERLSVGLAECGCRVDVVTERRDRAWPRSEAIGGVGVRRIPVLPKPGIHTLTSVLSLAWFLAARGRRYDVWHVHQYGVACSVAVFMGRLLRRPVVVKLTNTGDRGLAATVRALFPSALHIALHRCVDGCLATSQRGAREASDFGIPANRIHAVPNMLDCDRFRPPSEAERASARSEFGVDDRVVLLFVGRLTAQKSPNVLVDAFASLVASNPEALLVVLGDGPLATSTRAHAAETLPPGAVRFEGNCEDPLSWYHAADLYVSSSSIEGLSNSLMEALGCGLPVVCTRVSGSEDLVEDAIGSLVEPGDATALAAALTKWSRDADRREKSRNPARALAVARFSKESVVASVSRVYRGLRPN